jgi:hypothetical protein
MARVRSRSLLALLGVAGALIAPATASALDPSLVTPGDYLGTGPASTVSWTIGPEGAVSAFRELKGDGDACRRLGGTWVATEKSGTAFDEVCQHEGLPLLTDHWAPAPGADKPITAFAGTSASGFNMTVHLVSDGQLSAAVAHADSATTALRVRCGAWAGRPLRTGDRCHGTVQLRRADGTTVTTRPVDLAAHRSTTVRVPVAASDGALRWRVDHYHPRTGKLRRVELPARGAAVGLDPTRVTPGHYLGTGELPVVSWTIGTDGSVSGYQDLQGTSDSCAAFSGSWVYAPQSSTAFNMVCQVPGVGPLFQDTWAPAPGQTGSITVFQGVADNGPNAGFPMTVRLTPTGA